MKSRQVCLILKPLSTDLEGQTVLDAAAGTNLITSGDNGTFSALTNLTLAHGGASVADPIGGGGSANSLCIDYASVATPGPVPIVRFDEDFNLESGVTYEATVQIAMANTGTAYPSTVFFDRNNGGKAFTGRKDLRVFWKVTAGFEDAYVEQISDFDLSRDGLDSYITVTLRITPRTINSGRLELYIAGHDIGFLLNAGDGFIYTHTKTYQLYANTATLNSVGRRSYPIFKPASAIEIEVLESINTRVSYQCDDLSKLGEINRSVSRQVEVPSSPSNLAKLGQLDNVGSDIGFCQSRQKWIAELVSEGDVLQQGVYLFLSDLQKGRKKMMSGMLKGEDSLWSLILKGKKWHQLESNAHNHPLDVHHVTNSWANTSVPYTYGLMDFGDYLLRPVEAVTSSSGATGNLLLLEDISLFRLVWNIEYLMRTALAETGFSLKFRFAENGVLAPDSDFYRIAMYLGQRIPVSNVRQGSESTYRYATVGPFNYLTTGGSITIGTTTFTGADVLLGNLNPTISGAAAEPIRLQHLYPDRAVPLRPSYEAEDTATDAGSPGLGSIPCDPFLPRVREFSIGNGAANCVRKRPGFAISNWQVHVVPANWLMPDDPTVSHPNSPQGTVAFSMTEDGFSPQAGQRFDFDHTLICVELAYKKTIDAGFVGTPSADNIHRVEVIYRHLISDTILYVGEVYAPNEPNWATDGHWINEVRDMGFGLFEVRYESGGVGGAVQTYYMGPSRIRTANDYDFATDGVVVPVDVEITSPAAQYEMGLQGCDNQVEILDLFAAVQTAFPVVITTNPSDRSVTIWDREKFYSQTQEKIDGCKIINFAVDYERRSLAQSYAQQLRFAWKSGGNPDRSRFASSYGEPYGDALYKTTEGRADEGESNITGALEIVLPWMREFDNGLFIPSETGEEGKRSVFERIDNVEPRFVIVDDQLRPGDDTCLAYRDDACNRNVDQGYATTSLYPYLFSWDNQNDLRMNLSFGNFPVGAQAIDGFTADPGLLYRYWRYTIDLIDSADLITSRAVVDQLIRSQGLPYRSFWKLEPPTLALLQNVQEYNPFECDLSLIKLITYNPSRHRQKGICFNPNAIPEFTGDCLDVTAISNEVLLGAARYAVRFRADNSAGSLPTVNQLLDIGGFNAHAAAVTGTWQQVTSASYNNQAVWQFDDLGDFRFNLPIDLGPVFTVYIIGDVQVSGAQASGGVILQPSAAGANSMRIEVDSTSEMGYVSTLGLSTAWPGGTPSLYGFQFARNGNDLVHTVGAVESGSTAGVTTADAHVSGEEFSVNGDGIEGNIAEIIILSGAPTVFQFVNLVNYVNCRYDLQIKI